jgi:hypothetical protein
MIKVWCNNCGERWEVKTSWRYIRRQAGNAMQGAADNLGRVNVAANYARSIQAQRDNPAGRQKCPRCGSTKTDSMFLDKALKRMTDEEQVAHIVGYQVWGARYAIRVLRIKAPGVTEEQIRDALRGEFPQNIIDQAVDSERKPE